MRAVRVAPGFKMLWFRCLLAVILIQAVLGEEESRVLSRLAGGHIRLDRELDTAQAGGGKDAPKSDHQDDKKTLSQQVADGKYGLIQKELFTKPAKRPGIISYKSNSEVPKDNANTLGGLKKNEIWLAENHLLVLKGGDFPVYQEGREGGQQIWPAIDDYKAPERQVKIPAHPKVPPPFPVQLTDDGPLQLLGTNTTRTINGSHPEATYALPPLPEGGYVPGTGPFFPPYYGPDTSDPAAGKAPESATPNPATPSGEYRPGDGDGRRQPQPPPPPPPFPNSNGTWPPSFASLPPGAVILPPPDNQTDFYDDDDPSIYYPPPYSFYYPTDNNTKVKAGPLVPGIILPPPPNFFGPLEETTTTTTTRRPKLTTKLSKVIKVTSSRPQSATKQRKKPTITVLRPVKPSTTLAPIYYKENEVSQQPFAKYGPPERPVTTSVPIKVYYSTTKVPKKPEPEIQINFLPKTSSTPNPQFYYYEQATKRPPIPVPQREPQVEIITKSSPQDGLKLYYVPNNRTPKQQQNSDTFSIHIAKLQQEIQEYVTLRSPTPRPVYQYSFEANNYKPKFQERPRYSVQIQPAIEIIPVQQSTTARPPVYYQQGFIPSNYNQQRNQYTATPRPVVQITTPNPIYQTRYTKPEDNAFDEITKEYFTVFGQKLQSSTTPLPPRFIEQRRPQQISLKGDTKVNYLNPRPSINPDAEFIPPQQKQKYQQQRPISLESDTKINYVNPRPTVNPEAEFIPPVNNHDDSYHQQQQQNAITNEAYDPRRGSYISYQLPGDNAHFYFLTPQLVKRTDQGAGYYYEKPNTASVLKRQVVR